MGGQGSGDGGLATARGSPEDHGPELALVDGASQRSLGAEPLVLTDDLGQIEGTHAIGEGAMHGSVRRNDPFEERRIGEHPARTSRDALRRELRLENG